MKVRCPDCLGYKFQGHKLCPTCEGAGTVNNEFRCECGRPAVISAGAELVCVSPKCFERATATPTHGKEMVFLEGFGYVLKPSAF